MRRVHRDFLLLAWSLGWPLVCFWFWYGGGRIVLLSSPSSSSSSSSASSSSLSSSSLLLSSSIVLSTASSSTGPVAEPLAVTPEHRCPSVLNSTEFVQWKRQVEEEHGAKVQLLQSIQAMEAAKHQEVVEYLMRKYRWVASELKLHVLELKNDARSSDATANSPVYKSEPCSKGILSHNQLEIKVATYNLWNVNEPWDKRRQSIAMLLEDLKPDIVALQEVRFYEGMNQLDQLVDDLNSLYPYRTYHAVHEQAVGKEEGLAILSRFPISNVSFFVIEVSEERRKANNEFPRHCMHAFVQLPNEVTLSLFNTHMTYLDTEQCRSVTQLIDFMDGFDIEQPQILLGDFNAYFDFPWPLDYLTEGQDVFSTNRWNPCSAWFTEHGRRKPTRRWRNLFRDAWTEIHPDLAGNTFPNFKKSRREDPSRPDRILFRDCSRNQGNDECPHELDVCGATLFGEQRIELDDKPEKEEMYPSDHRGVLVSYRVH